jgi:predicted transcriptional regulator
LGTKRPSKATLKIDPKVLEDFQELLDTPREFEPAPEGWYTAPELAEALGTSMTTLKNRLYRGMAAGTVERAHYYVNRNGHITRMYHYHVKEGAKCASS